MIAFHHLILLKQDKCWAVIVNAINLHREVRGLPRGWVEIIFQIQSPVLIIMAPLNNRSLILHSCRSLSVQHPTSLAPLQNGLAPAFHAVVQMVNTPPDWLRADFHSSKGPAHWGVWGGAGRQALAVRL